MSRIKVCPLCNGKENSLKMAGVKWLSIAANNGSNEQKRFVCANCSVWTDTSRPHTSKGSGIKNQLDIIFSLTRKKAYGFGMTEDAIPGFLKATFEGCTTYPLEGDEIRLITSWTAKVNNIRALLANVANIGEIVSVRSLERAEKTDKFLGKVLTLEGVTADPKQKNQLWLDIAVADNNLGLDEIANLITGFHESCRMDFVNPNKSRKISGRIYTGVKYREGNPLSVWDKMFQTDRIAAIRRILNRGTKTSQYHDKL